MGLFDRTKKYTGEQLYQMMHGDWDVDSPTRKKTMEKVISLSAGVEESLAYLATAQAYISLGAEYRNSALVCFDKYFAVTSITDIYYCGACMVAGGAYEAEYEFEKAEKYYKLHDLAWEKHPNYKYFGAMPNVKLGRLYLKLGTQKALDYWSAQMTTPDYSKEEFKRTVDFEYSEAIKKHAKGYVYKPRREIKVDE